MHGSSRRKLVEAMSTPFDFLVLSNGHGEDGVGARLLAELQRRQPELKLAAFPTVDEGNAYASLGVPILGPRRRLPSGGLLLHDPRLLWDDVKAGFLSMTAAQLRDLRRVRTRNLIVVGDVWALLLSSLVKTERRFFVQTLVSARHHPNSLHSAPTRYFMERISYPERALMRHLADRVYVRDEATAAVLWARGLTFVSALGNPLLDGLSGTGLSKHKGLCIALLPGTRGYAPAALTTMLEALEELPAATGLVAWSGESLPPAPTSWQLETLPQGSDPYALYRNAAQEVFVYKNRFADILHTTKLVLGTSGTAHEQAAALGKPVVAFPVPPLYSEAFLHNQKRLLGEALTLSEPTAPAIGRAITDLLANEDRFRRAASTGRQRLGAGGTSAIVDDVLARASG